MSDKIQIKTLNIICDRCDNTLETDELIEDSLQVDHIRCNFCPLCDRNDDYYEEWYCDSKGKSIDYE